MMGSIQTLEDINEQNKGTMFMKLNSGGGIRGIDNSHKYFK